MREISGKDIQDILGLTPMQEGMLFHYLKTPDTGVYFEQLCLGISGYIDKQHFQTAWERVVEWNPALRSLFRWEKLENPVRIILRKHVCDISYYDLSHLEPNKKNREVEEIMAGERIRGFDLQEVPFRIILLKLKGSSYNLIICNHHILFDGWSTGIIINEFFQAYYQSIKNRSDVPESVIPRAKPPFKDFVKWIQDRDKKKQEIFWRHYLEGFDTRAPLPIKNGKPGENKEIENLQAVLEEDQKNRLNAFIRTHRLTLAAVFYCAWGLLIQGYSRRDDVVFGTTVSGRSAPTGIDGIETIVGLFINTLPMRIKSHPGQTAGDLLQYTKNTLLEREKHETTALVDIDSWVSAGHDHPLFDSIVVIENYPLDRRLMKKNSETTGALHVDSYRIEAATNYDLTLGIVLGDVIELNFNYPGSRFERNNISRLSHHFLNILDELMQYPDIDISSIDFLTTAEKDQLLYRFHSTVPEAAEQKPLHGLLQDQVRATPDVTVLKFKDRVITYGHLNHSACQLAAALQTKGIGPDIITGLMMERSMEMVTAILGILMAGGAYLPIDPLAPGSRTSYMMADSAVHLLLTDRKAQVPSDFRGTVSTLEDLFAALPEAHCPPLANQKVRPANLAYIIYTSGTTGRPKGTAVEHQGVINMLKRRNQHYGFSARESELQLFSYTFDGFVAGLFTPVLFGASAVLLSEGDAGDIASIKAAITRYCVTRFIIVPPLFQQLLDLLEPGDLGDLTTVTLAGDRVTPQLMETARRKLPHLEIAVEYGVTEASVMSTIQRHQENTDAISIGEPIANTRLLVLDHLGRLQPVGLPGELCIGAAGPARGYLNRPELTAQRFVDLYKSYGSFRSYKTGDLVRWLPDGRLEFLGRIDNQVKIRGFRIETGEIENRLADHPSISDAVVSMKKETSGEAYLCAYVVLEPAEEIPPLDEYLAIHLPSYMIPSHFIRLDHIPLTPTGKIDRKALPDPQIQTGSRYSPPRNPVERKLVELFAEILGKDPRQTEELKNHTGIHDNFFRMGGHSLKATSLAAKIYKEFDIQLPLSQVFDGPTIAELAEQITESPASGKRYIPIPPVESRDYYTASSAQKRLYFLQELDRTSTAYNMPSVWELHGQPDIKWLESVFRQLVQRHESFRTSFHMVAKEPVQVIHETVDVSIERLELTTRDVETISNSFIRPFDLEKAPLLRVGIILLPEIPNLMVVDMHHIIADGLSAEVFITDFITLADRKTLPPLIIQYKDYSQWQTNRLSSSSEQSLLQESFWMEQMEGDIPVLELPVDFPRSSLRRFEGKTVDFRLEAAETQNLAAFAHSENTTLFMVLMALYTIFLAKISGQEELVVGTPVAGRQHPGLDGVVGMFVNTLALRNYPEGEKTVLQLLEEIKLRSLQAFENQEFPYEDLLEKVLARGNISRDPSRNPLLDTVFALENIDIPDARAADFSLKPLPFHNRTSKFDLTLMGFEIHDTLHFAFEYCTTLFKPETLDRFTGHFKHIITTALKNPGQTLRKIDILSGKEKRLILNRFNNTEGEYPKDKPVHRVFGEIAAAWPDRAALHYKDLTLTYGYLDTRTGHLAQSLICKGSGTGSITALKVERTPEMIMGILAILKTGGAYMPIDPDYPEERIDYMLNDSNATFLITTDNISALLHSTRSSQPETGKTGSDDLAYVMYTSGSTGKPKGVMVDHRSVVRLVCNTDFVELSSKTRVLLTGAPVFDATTFEIWGPLLNAGQLTIVDKETILAAQLLGQAILRYDIDTMWLSSPLFNQLAREDPDTFVSLQWLVVGGDVLSPNYINRVRARSKSLAIVNGYGPTENTTFSCSHRIQRDYTDSIPIGRPIRNSTAYVVDKYGQLQPIGIFGELWVGGDGISRGYLNNPHLTAQRFIEFKWSVVSHRLYKTGDIARWLPDGTIEFAGRVDNQVKIRGFRIELNEIENALLSHIDVQETVVIVKEREHEKFLAAYVTSDNPLEPAELRDFLSRQLPGYMVPAYFIWLESLPLTPNGKVNRKDLPEPATGAWGEGNKAPRNTIEKKLAGIWAGVLDIPEDTLGIDDSFFDLGGHSLKATQLAAQVRRVLNAEVPLTEIFVNPSIRDMAEYIKQSAEIEFSPIDSVEKREYYPLSSAQERLYILHRMNPGSTWYNLPFAAVVTGEPEILPFEAIMRKIIRRHESLRTSFFMKDNRPVQRVHDTVDFSIDHSSLEQGVKSPEGDETGIANLTPDNPDLNSFIRPFNLSQAPLLRFTLARINDHRQLLTMDMHHIISDGASMGLLIKEIADLYEGRELLRLPVQYRDFTLWQHSFKGSDEYKKQETFWMHELREEPPVLDLPTDFKRPAVPSVEGSTLTWELSVETSEQLKRLASAENTTLFTVLLSVFYIFLAKITGQQHVVVGTPVAGRRHAQLETVVGMFVNTLGIASFPRDGKSFKDFLQETNHRNLEAFENQDYPFEDLVAKVAPDRNTGRNPLFDVLFTLRNLGFSEKEITIPGMQLTPLPCETGTAKFDLLLQAVEDSSQLIFSFQYSTALFKQRTVQRFAGYFRRTAEAVINTPAIHLEDIGIISSSEKVLILNRFNDTATQYPAHQPVHRLLEETAARQPDSTAVVYEEHHLSYAALEHSANRLALYLKEQGAQPGMPVGLILEPGLNVITGVTAILKAGCGYLPISPDYPRDRIEYILNDSNAGFLLTADNMSAALPAARSPQPLTLKISSTNLAYIMYTSGSTGRPKGVMVEHRSVVRLVRNTRFIELQDNDRILQTGALEFDASTFEIWGALLNGLTLFLAPQEKRLNPIKLKELLVSRGVTVIWMTSPLFNQLVQSDPGIFSRLRCLLVGGDVLSPPHIHKIRKLYPRVNIINGYGPTENTTFSTTFLIEEDYGDNIPIGKPISNSTAYILDRNGFPQPVGIAGELWVGGDGVSRGYLNNPELTAERFSRYGSQNSPGSDSLYRTGDLAKWLPDGNILFLGRIDQQVKIRGFRVEPDEIANCLLSHSAVTDAVVAVWKEPGGEKFLCVYYVSRQDCSPPELKQHLSHQLPDYMIPLFFIPLEKLPLTPNGKVDRRMLPEPAWDSSQSHRPPRNAIENKVAELWAEVLNVEKAAISIDADFFQLGGHSLKATLLVSKIQQALDAEISLMDIFTFPTLKEFAARIKQALPVRGIPIEPVEKREYYHASSAQKRLFVLQQLDEKGIGYNMPSVSLLEGTPDKTHMEEVFHFLIQRHESLRTSFVMMESEPVQRVHDTVNFAIKDFDLATKESENNDRVQHSNFIIHHSIVRPFNLAKAPLLRVGLITLDKGKHLLVLDMHHIVSDGTSMGILAKEFMEQYGGHPLTDLHVQYKDVTLWQNTSHVWESVNAQKQYWLDQLAGEIPVLNLPLDFKRPGVQRFEGRVLGFETGQRETTGIIELAQQEGCTLFMTLLAIFTVFLSRISGQDHIIVGTPAAGRRSPELQNIIGMFVNTLVLKNIPAPHKSFIEFLHEVKQTSTAALENQDYPFEELVEQLELNRDPARNPLFDVMFVLQTMEVSKLELPGLTLRPYDYDSRIAKFDLMLQGEESDGKLVFHLEYSTRLFRQDTIQRFITIFKRIISTITAGPGITIGALDILPETDKKKILEQFNRTAAQFPREKTLFELFIDKTAQIPDAIALVGPPAGIPMAGSGSFIHHWSYNMLAQQALGLALRLMEKGAGPETIVAIRVERSLEMVFGIFGILAAGAAYLPISPDSPEERVRYILQDSGAGLLLTTGDSPLNVMEKPEIAHLEGTKYCAPTIHSCPRHATPAQPCYIIYTSGSTGRPKGVLVNHISAVNLLTGLQNAYPLTIDDAYLFKTACIFDVSVSELFGWYMGGGRQVILPRDGEKDPHSMLDCIERELVTHVNFVPSMFTRFVDVLGQGNAAKLARLRYIFLAGEALLPDVVESFRQLKTPIRLENLYGPTEATVYASGYSLEMWDNNLPVPIGRPLTNVTLYILDNRGHLQPIGIPGELVIGGEGIARGYLNRPELTEERFIDSNWTDDSDKYYKSGDLARWLTDGNIEFLGRLDHQVKIRGFRIELGEIEDRLLKCDLVRDAVVVARDDINGDKYLCAYVVKQDNSTGMDLDTDRINECLALDLPTYMIPPFFVELDALPLNPSGKLDRKALPEPSLKTAGPGTPPANEIERKLVELWGEVLSISGIGVEENFFKLGGHSLTATLLAVNIHRAFDVQVTLTDIFKTPTIRGLARNISAADKNKFWHIPVAELKEYYPMSSAQKRLYLLQDIDETGISYNLPSVSVLEGKLDKGILEHAFKEVIRHHESLRTSFLMINGEPVQRVHKNVDFSIENLYSTQGDSFQKSFARPFDLTAPPLLRVGLARAQEGQALLLMDMHHIISDGTSLVILVKDLMTAYNGDALHQSRIQYRDFAEWQCSAAVSEQAAVQQNYWLAIFKDEIPVLNLPLDKQRPGLQRFEGETRRFYLEEKQVHQLKALSLKEETTLFMVLLSLYTLLLNKLSGQEDIVVGTPVAGRRHADLRSIVGMFVNTLALRHFPSGDQPFLLFLRNVKKRTLEAFQHQDFPYEDLVEKLALTRDASRNPLFDTMFVMQNIDTPEPDIPGWDLKLIPRDYKSNISKFDLSFYAVDTGGTLEFTMEFGTHLFNGETVGCFIDYFKTLVNTVLENPEMRLRDAALLGEDQQRRLLEQFNDTAADFPREKTLIRLFREQVARTPHHTAVTAPGVVHITYRELDRLSLKVANRICEDGVRPGAIVGLMVERSVEMLVGILGILATGGAYLPIDPAYPRHRIDYMLGDSNAALLLTTGSISAALHTTRKPKPVTHNAETADIAYIIYTSGSTGKPKGVMVEHRAVVNLVTALQQSYPLGPGDTYLLKTTFIFDVSVAEIFGWYQDGGRLAILEADAQKDPEKLLGIIERERITHINFVPSMFQAFIFLINRETRQRLKGLKHIFLAGEALQPGLVSTFQHAGTGVTLENLYGPTEATVYASGYSLDKWVNQSPVPIGKPLVNVILFIFDTYGHIQPPGIPGELVIGGAGIARGYLNRPRLTAERFIDYRSHRAYKTGDLARWLPDGNIEFLGRMDHQVKVRGYRIELGEIEHLLGRYEGINEAVVTARNGTNGETFLAAYITGQQEFGADAVKRYLAARLPEYMIPPYIIQLDSMPLNPSGKIDRAALPKPEHAVSRGYAAPGTILEKKLTEIWEEVLGGTVGIDDDFFDMGGHSLKAALTVVNIHKELNISMTSAELFKTPTIRQLAGYLEDREETGFRYIPAQEQREFYPLSWAQKGVYLAQQLEPQSTSYNMPGAFIIEGNPDRKKIEHAFQALILRHESLRTSFFLNDGQPVQRVHQTVHFSIEHMDFTNEDLEKNETIQNSIVRPFNLSMAPLLRLRLGILEKGKYLLLLDMHHIISDGLSMKILADEFHALYRGEGLEPLRIHYKDYASWQNRGLEAGELKKQETYWLENLNGFQLTRFPFHWTRGHKPGGKESLILDNDRVEKVQGLCDRCRVTRFVLMLTIFNLLLVQETGETDITIGTPAANRDHDDVKRVMGLFLNVLVIRTRLHHGITFAQALGETKRSVLGAMDNNTYPYELLSRKIKEKFQLNENRLFSIMFNYFQEEAPGKKGMDGIKMSALDIQEVSPKYDATLYVRDTVDRIELNLVYRSNIVDTQRAGRLVRSFVPIIETLYENPDIDILETVPGEDTYTDDADFGIELGSGFENEDLI